MASGNTYSNGHPAIAAMVPEEIPPRSLVEKPVEPVTDAIVFRSGSYIPRRVAE